MYLIEANHLSKTFIDQNTKICALDDLSLKIPEGKIFGILGPNGAGKTTLISILSGLIEPDSGEIFVDGFEIEKNLFETKSKINVVSGFTGIIYTLNVSQALNYYSLLYGKSNNWVKIRELISLVSLNGYESNSAENLSSGNKQKFLIARALLNDPKILFLDEPTVGLDVESSINIRNLIKKLKSLGKTIILTTHNMAEAELLCDEIAIMKKGKIIAINSPTELRKKFEMPLSFEIEFSSDDSSNEIIKVLNSIAGISLNKTKTSIKIQFPKSSLSSFLKSISLCANHISSLKSVEDPFDEVFLNILSGDLK